MCEYFEFAVLENKTLADNRRTVFVDSPPVSLLLHFFQTHQLFPQSLWHLCSLQIKATDQSIWMADSSLKCKTYYTGHFTERFSSVLCQTVLTNSISMWTTLHVHACGREGASWWWEDEMMDGIPGSLLPDLDQSFRWTKEVRQTCGPGIGTNIQVLLIECRPTVLKKQKCCPSVESVMVLLLQKKKKKIPRSGPSSDKLHKYWQQQLVPVHPYTSAIKILRRLVLKSSHLQDFQKTWPLTFLIPCPVVTTK